MLCVLVFDKSVSRFKPTKKHSGQAVSDASSNEALCFLVFDKSVSMFKQTKKHSGQVVSGASSNEALCFWFRQEHFHVQADKEAQRSTSP